MTTPYQVLREYFDLHELKYNASEEHQLVALSMTGRQATYSIVGVIGHDDQVLQFFAAAPTRIPEGARRAIAETLTRINNDVKIGKFDLDFSDGQLRYHVAQCFYDRLPGELIHRAFLTSIMMLERYLPAVMSVVYGNETPEDALRHMGHATFAQAE